MAAKKTRKKSGTKPKKRTPTTKPKTKRRKSSTSSSSGGTMARKRRSSTKKTVTKRRPKPRTNLKTVILNVLTMLGGGVAASIAANKLPISSAKTKALVPLGIGAAAVIVGAKKRKATAVSLGTGMMLIGGLSAIRANFSSVPLLAGENSDVLELMGEMDLVQGDDDYSVPQLEYAGEDDLDGEEYYIEGEDDLDISDDLDGEEYYIEGEDDLDGDMYEISGGEFKTPASI